MDNKREKSTKEENMGIVVIVVILVMGVVILEYCCSIDLKWVLRDGAKVLSNQVVVVVVVVFLWTARIQFSCSFFCLGGDVVK